MNKVVRRGLNLLIMLTTLVMICVGVTVIASAEEGDTFTVNNIEGVPITYEITSEGESFEVEVYSCFGNYSGVLTLPEIAENPNDGSNYSVTSIGKWAFMNSSLAGIIIPDSVTNIDWNAFRGCQNLRSIEIPESVTDIGPWAFYDCYSLTDVDIPDSVESIGKYAFYNCKSLTEIEIPESVTKIEEDTFGCCTSLTDVEIPDSVTSIGKYAFGLCTSLTSIEIPDSVTSIGPWAFRDCKNLSRVYCYSLKAPRLGSAVFDNCASGLVIYIPTGTEDAYVAAGWSNVKLVEQV